MYTEPWRSEEVSDRGVGGDLCGLDVCLCQMNDVIFPPTLWKMREGRVSTVKEHARWKDARQMSAHTFPPSLLCSFFCSLLPSLFITTSNPSHFFLLHFGVGRYHRPLPAGMRLQSIQEYQLLLNLLFNCQVPHPSRAHTDHLAECGILFSRRRYTLK